MYDLIKSYLNNRKQIVVINDEQSEKKMITYGVPQGTVLGPLPFLVYINSLREMRTECECISFADDAVVLYEESSWADLENTVKRDFEKINKWFQKTLEIYT